MRNTFIQLQMCVCVRIFGIDQMKGKSWAGIANINTFHLSCHDHWIILIILPLVKLIGSW